MPQAWPEWAANPANLLFLFEIENEPAALYCLRVGLAGPNTGWVQGVRVSPDFRKRGLAAAIIEHAIKVSREQGLTALRYVTALENTPMHRVAERFGFRMSGNFLSSYHTKTKPLNTAGLPYRLVTTSEFDGAFHLITTSADYGAANGFYCEAWLWKTLTVDALRLHIEQREVYTLVGALSALAILSKDKDGVYWLAYLTGEVQAAQVLIQQLIKKIITSVAPGQTAILNALLPQSYIAETVLAQTGFQADPHEPVLTLYELSLT